MSKTVFKHPLSIDGPQEIELTGPVVHAAAVDSRTICLWAEWGAEPHREVRRFQVFGTGHDVPDTAKHVATVHDGIFVWHVYELGAAQ